MVAVNVGIFSPSTMEMKTRQGARPAVMDTGHSYAPPVPIHSAGVPGCRSERPGLPCAR